MPRTRVVRKKAEKCSPFIANLKSNINDNFETLEKRLDEEKAKFMMKLKLDLKQTKLSIPSSLLNKTLGELAQLPPHWCASSSASSIQILEATRTLTESKRNNRVRSSSAGDEGYLTTESTNSTAGAARKSRAREKKLKTERVSRSLSTRQKAANKYKTPAGKLPPATYATVTPKVKPNTPQVLLRRPKLGEVALSLQGSPLMTGTVMSDNVANINIPLEDGRLLSIQPQRGLRLSQIPQLDVETTRQLEALRDNLNKVCAISAKR